MGRWRLTPPGYGGTCLPAGRSAGLTRHRRVIQYREPLKGKTNGGASFNTADPSRGRLSGVRRSRERLGRCGGRREKHLPWRGQAVAGASAPVNVHAVLLSDNGDNGLCPREDAGNHGLVQRAEEVQKRSFCRRSFPHFFRCWKKWGRRRQRKRSRRGAKLSLSLRRGRGEHLIRHGFAGPPVSLWVGRFADLTRHRRVIQHRGPPRGKA